MSTRKSDIIHFYDLLREERFDEAEADVRRRVQDGDADATDAANGMAAILWRRGKMDEALAVLTKVINDGQDRIQMCRFSRADVYLKKGDGARAERDYLCVLDDSHPILVRSFHSTAAFRIAWIRALQGDPSYTSYLARCPDQDRGFIVDRIVTRAQMDAVYAKQRGKRVSEKR